MFRALVPLIGEEHWLTDPRFDDDQARGDHGEVISKRMAEWCAERTCAEALAELEKASIAAGPVYSPQQALDDAHIRAAELLEDTRLSGAAATGAAGADPDRSVRDARALSPPAPLLGEHTDADPQRAGLQRRRTSPGFAPAP